MKQYHDLLSHVLDNGVDCNDRTGVGTRSIFGYQLRFNLNDGFPAVTTKRLAWKAVVGELLWFLEGSTDERRLAEITYESHRVNLINKTTIWTANANAQGKALGHINNEFTKELGPVYGAQWRNFNGSGVDQISNISRELRTNPDSRRIILTAFNPAQIDQMALPPCHMMSQFRMVNGKLSCQLYLRSSDTFLGLPFNIASTSLLLSIIAKLCNKQPNNVVIDLGDTHIYEEHYDQINIQLNRQLHPLPSLIIDKQIETINDVENLSFDDFKLIDYFCENPIKATMKA